MSTRWFAAAAAVGTALLVDVRVAASAPRMFGFVALAPATTGQPWRRGPAPGLEILGFSAVAVAVLAGAAAVALRDRLRPVLAALVLVPGVVGAALVSAQALARYESGLRADTVLSLAALLLVLALVVGALEVRPTPGPSSGSLERSSAGPSAGAPSEPPAVQSAARVSAGAPTREAADASTVGGRGLVAVACGAVALAASFAAWVGGSPSEMQLSADVPYSWTVRDAWSAGPLSAACVCVALAAALSDLLGRLLPVRLPGRTPFALSAAASVLAVAAVAGHADRTPAAWLVLAVTFLQTAALARPLWARRAHAGTGRSARR